MLCCWAVAIATENLYTVAWIYRYERKSWSTLNSLIEIAFMMQFGRKTWKEYEKSGFHELLWILGENHITSLPCERTKEWVQTEQTEDFNLNLFLYFCNTSEKQTSCLFHSHISTNTASLFPITVILLSQEVCLIPCYGIADSFRLKTCIQCQLSYDHSCAKRNESSHLNIYTYFMSFSYLNSNTFRTMCLS